MKLTIKNLLSLGICTFIALTTTTLKAGEIVDYKITVPPPQAYSFAQYADMPVSLYTGTPSIDIPLYTIQVGEYSFPISLSYHASGIKVSQEASWVGLGWNLNAGGNISRTARGIEDLEFGYYDQNNQIPPEVDFNRNDLLLLEIIDKYSAMFKFKVDTEPDVFYYNFMGYTGKFYCKNSGSKEENGFYTENPEHNLKISFSYLGPKFSITTPDGIQYIFETSSSIKTSSVKFDKIIGPYTDMKSFPYDDHTRPITTSWDLSEIILPNKEKITFEYTSVKDPFLPSSSNIIQKKYHMIDIINTGQTYFGDKNEETIFFVGRVSYQKFLKTITWPSGSISFSTSSRLDFKKNASQIDEGCPKLDKMSIFKTGENRPIKEIIFHESYFANPDKPEDCYNLRLRLDSISEYYGSICDVHKFGYDTRHPLPPKYSLAQDLWGYYNGINNTTYFYPSITVSQNYTKSDGKTVAYKKGDTLSGCDRKTRAEYITTAMLTSIESPEGAITQFEYEPNTAEVEYEKIGFLRKDTLRKAVGSNSIVSFDFSIPNNAYIRLYFHYREDILGVSRNIHKDSIISIYNHKGIRIKNWGHQNFPPGKFNWIISDSSKYEKGDYRLVLRANDLSQEIFLTIYDAPTVVGPAPGGGVRIARIKSPINTKEFLYTKEDGTSTSGIFVREPFHESVQGFYKKNNNQIDALVTYLVQQSDPVYPLASPTVNSAIGYSCVRVITRGEDKSIQEEYCYYNQQEKVNRRFVGLPGEQIYTNGKLKSYRMYNGNELEQNTEYEYRSDTVAILNAWFQDYCNFGVITAYHVPIEHCRLEQETQTTYDHTHRSENTKTTTYTYNSSNYQPSEVSVYDGLQEKTVRTTYSVDLKDQTPYSEMCDNVNNRVSLPIETRSYKNGDLVQKELHTYKKNTKSGNFVPDAVYNYYLGSKQTANDFNGSNLSQYGLPDYTLSGYDKYDNITEVKSRTGESEVYIWGYNGQYVIARIVNATRSLIESYGIGSLDSFASGAEPSEADWNKLNALRNSLPQCMVYTYKYEPMVGLIETTDPKGMTLYYEYDAKGRLTIERDNNRNMIRSYRYTQKNER